MIDSDHLRRTSITYDWLGTMFDPSENNMKKKCVYFSLPCTGIISASTELKQGQIASIPRICSFDGHVHTSPGFMVEHITFQPHFPTLNQQILPYLASELRGLNVWIWRNHRTRREIHTSMAVVSCCGGMRCAGCSSCTCAFTFVVFSFFVFFILA